MQVNNTFMKLKEKLCKRKSSTYLDICNNRDITMVKISITNGITWKEFWWEKDTMLRDNITIERENKTMTLIKGYWEEQ